MKFTLKVVADRPTDGELVLEPETPLCGIAFIEQVGKCLRRSIDHVSRSKHVILGALVTYEFTVPQAMAIESGKFNNSNTHTITVENNLLSHFVFYAANIVTGPAGRRCYPFTENEATLTSLIDELGFLDAWANAKYADRLVMNGNMVVDGSYGCNTGILGTGSTGGIGCGGCTCGTMIGDPDCVPNPQPGQIILTPEGCGCGDGCDYNGYDRPPCYHHCPPAPPPLIGNGQKPEKPPYMR